MCVCVCVCVCVCSIEVRVDINEPSHSMTHGERGVLNNNCTMFLDYYNTGYGRLLLSLNARVVVNENNVFVHRLGGHCI